MTDARPALRFTAPLPTDTRVGGGKAASLALLQRCGMLTPQGFVCTDAVLRALVQEVPAELLAEHVMRAAWPTGFLPELQQQLTQLQANAFSVRSSFAREDDANALAAGVYQSFVNISADDVPEAARRVWASALEPAALAYAQAHGNLALQEPLCVLVHPYVAGVAWGHAAAAPAQDIVNVWVGKGALTANQKAELQHAVTGVALCHGASEIEWVHNGDAFVYLQWRPFVPAAPAAPWQPSPQNAHQTAAPPTTQWAWDASHNPAPLSPAQQGLVAMVQQHCEVGFDQQVFGGYLFYRRHDHLAPTFDPAQVDQAFDDLQKRVQEDLKALATPPPLEDALGLFLKHYAELVGGIGRAVKQGRQRFVDFVALHAPLAADQIAAALVPLGSKAQERQQRLARVRAALDSVNAAQAWDDYVALFGDDPVAWDVCAPTQRELSVPSANAQAMPAAETLLETRTSAWQQIKEAVAPTWLADLEKLYVTALACAARGEDDDWLYARLQAPIRRALQSLGDAWAAQGCLAQASDVFFVPLPLVREAAAAPQTPSGLQEAAAFGKAAHAQQTLNPPPTTPGNGLRGHGTGGRVVGKVKHHKAGQRCDDTTVVLVGAALLPTELPLLAAAAFVVETGGPLDHVAAQARERGLPAVVGVTGALQALAEGDLVLVDGDAGVVLKVSA